MVESIDELIKRWIGFGEVEWVSGLSGWLRFAAVDPGYLWAVRGRMGVLNI